MRKIALAFLAVAALCTATMIQNASAASATYNWTGWYLGLNAGGNWGSSQPSHLWTQPPFGTNAFRQAVDAGGSQSFNTSGFTGGIQGGYNWQFGSMLAGFEVDFEYFRSAGSRTVTGSALGTSFSINTAITTDWLFTARPRLGFVTNNWLVYGTGGLAVTNLKASSSFSDPGPESDSSSWSKTKAGWTAGGGVEVAFPGKWTLGAEYLYVKFTSISTVTNNFISVGTPVPSIFTNSSIDLASSIVRVRLNKIF